VRTGCGRCWSSWASASFKDAGYDIGMERAIREWLQRNYLVWAPEELEDEDAEQSEDTHPAPPT
jgi:hypothetical protein